MENLAHLTFGCEFEVFFPNNPRHRFGELSASAEVTRRTGFRWDIHGDGSIRDNTGSRSGIEFVSPVLRGQSGLDQVAVVANALRDMGAQVNASCGFHVHVGAAGNDLTFFKNLVKLYASYEREIDEVMPVSRRSNNAGFCRSLTNINFAVIDRATSLRGLISEVARSAGASTDRYVKLNLAAMDRHGTVEFRHHSGTVDAVKAVNWIIRCLQLVTAAKEGNVAAAPQIAREYARFAFKTRVVIEMISRPEGATTAELCARAGARRMGVKRHARLAGFGYRKRGKRYFMVTHSDAPVVSKPLDEVLNATAEQREFWNQRREALRRAR